jgi:hypothetical protein
MCILAESTILASLYHYFHGHRVRHTYISSLPIPLSQPISYSLTHEVLLIVLRLSSRVYASETRYKRFLDKTTRGGRFPCSAVEEGWVCVLLVVMMTFCFLDCEVDMIGKITQWIGKGKGRGRMMMVVVVLDNEHRKGNGEQIGSGLERVNRF